MKRALWRRPAPSLSDQAFDRAGVGMAYLRGERFIKVNRAFSDLVGYSSEELEGSSFLDITHPDHVAQNRADAAAMLEQRRPRLETDKRFIRKDGSEVWVSLVATLVTSDQADRLIVVQDITTRKAAEQHAIREHDKLEGALASMPDAVFLSDADGNVVNYNKAFLKFHRLSHLSDLDLRFGKIPEFNDLLTHDGRLLTIDEWPLSRALRGETGVDVELKVRRKGTRESWFASYNFAPVRGRDGEIAGAVVVARDVSDRREAERMLQQERDKIKAALFSMQDAVFISNLDGDAIEFNDAFVSFHRFADRDEAFRALAEYAATFVLSTPDGVELTVEDWPISRALRGEVGTGDELKYRRTDTGEWWYGSINFAPIRAPDGTITGSVVVLRDVTQRRLAQAALQASREELERMVEERTRHLAEAKREADRANEAKTRFLAAASHDLRQPLQAAKAYLAAFEKAANAADADAILKGLGTSLSVMGRMLGTMLDMSQLQAGLVQPKPTVFSMPELLKEAVHATLPGALEKHLDVQWDFEPCQVSTDRVLLLSVVHNLLANAVKYTEQGFIAVRCRVANDIVSVEIEDSGIGIPEEDQAKIFLEYVQVANPARNPELGIGLGLSLVKTSLDLLGIELHLQSVVDQGTKFWFELPSAAPADAGEPLDAAAPAHTGATLATILFVEDDFAVRDSFTILLRAYGYTVHPAASGEEALQLVASGATFDLMISDYRLPDMRGTDVIQRARAMRGVEFPVVLVTGETMLDEIRDRHIADCTIISKPVRIPVLIELLEQLGAKLAAGV